ncbi:MAG: Rnase Y domain-containing protein, partial [Lachnospiraceae bacterium]|nr:Rnase Y domain-containing protein [Lachnospiraceae bacterium]
MSQSIITIVAAVVVGIICFVIAWFLSKNKTKKDIDNKVGSAEARSRAIIDEAMKTAEAKKREALLEAKEENLKTKNELDKEVKERRSELQHYEKRVLQKEENLDKKQESLERKEESLQAREGNLAKKSQEVEDLYRQGVAELEKISGLTSEQAKELLLQTIEEDVKHDKAKLIKELDTEAK